MSNNEKYVIHHRGSPREDADYGPLVIAIAAIGGAIVAVNLIIAVLPFLLAAGVISVGTYFFISTKFAKLKFKRFQLDRIQKNIEAARQAEIRSQEATAFLTQEEKTIAKQAAEKITKSRILEFELKREEVLKLLQSGLDRLTESRTSALKAAGSAKSPEKFKKGMNKLDEAIQKLEAHMREIRESNP